MLRNKQQVEVISMALVRCVTEMGMGVDVHGLDYTSAANPPARPNPSGGDR